MYESDSDSTEKEDGDSSGIPKKTGSSPQKPVGYRIKNVLKVPRPTTYTTQAIYEQIHSSDINLEPEYQRDVVWPEAKQIGVIDSIFRNFYIPPVIFAVNQFEDGSETKTCIDGKQRLTSIYRFMDGLICHKDPFTNEKLWYKGGGNGSKGPKKILPEKYRRLFANKQIVCIEYQDITDDDEREIFQRVQLGMALTPAEKLQAIRGPMSTFIRELNTTYLTEGGLIGDTLEWDRSRGSDFRCLAETLYAIEKSVDGLGSYSTMPQLERWLGQSPEPTPEFRETVHNIYRVFTDLVHDKLLNGVFGMPAKISPIEFIMISLLISVHKDKLIPAQLSTAIGLMRADARTQHVDIRMNGRVAKTMIEFIQDYKVGKLNSRDCGETADLLARVGTKRKRDEQRDTRTDPDVYIQYSRPPEYKQFGTALLLQKDFATSNPAVPTDGRLVLLPENSASKVPDRLAAIRAAKDKLTSVPISLPPSAPTALRINFLPSSIQAKTENVDSLESGLMAKMASGQSMSSNWTAAPLDRCNKPTRSRYSSPEGRGRSRSSVSEQDIVWERDRDRSPHRSISSDQSRTRRSYDGTQDWDYKSHRGRHREYPGNRRDSKARREEHH